MSSLLPAFAIISTWYSMLFWQQHTVLYISDISISVSHSGDHEESSWPGPWSFVILWLSLCISADNRLNPLNRVHSSADAQAVTVHFIIIGSSTSGEEGDIKGVRATEETDRLGRWGGLDRRGRAGESEGWMGRETSSEGWMRREGGVGRKRTEREKGALSQPFNRVGLEFRWSGLRADGLKAHCGSRITSRVWHTEGGLKTLLCQFTLPWDVRSSVKRLGAAVTGVMLLSKCLVCSDLWAIFRLSKQLQRALYKPANRNKCCMNVHSS